MCNHFSPSRSTNFFLITGFLLILVLPPLATCFSLKLGTPLLETREQAPLPSIKKESLSEFPAQFDNYLSDHIGFRNLFQQAEIILLMRAFKTIPCATPFRMGKDGFLFPLLHDQLDYIRAYPPPPENEIHHWVKLLEQRNEWLRSMGISYFVVIAPAKNNIYEDYLPDGIRRAGTQTRREKLLEALKSSDINILDLAPALAEAKKKHQVYYANDTHWNQRGGFAGYQALMDWLSKQFPVLRPREENDFILKPTINRRGDILRSFGIEKNFPEPDIAYMPRFTPRAKTIERVTAGNARALHNKKMVTEVDDPTLPTAVVFRDSFTNTLQPWMSEHFRKITYFWSTQKPIQFLTEEILREKPDMVIQEFVEAYLPTLPTDTLEAVSKFLGTKFEKMEDVLHEGISNVIAINDAVLHPSPNVLMIQSTGIDPSLEVPLPPDRPVRKAVIHIKISSPSDTLLQIFHRSASRPVYSGEYLETLEIKKGLNDCYFEAVSQDPIQAIRIDPGLIPGDYRIEMLEIRGSAEPLETSGIAGK